jgi:hypothetical protein
MENADALLEIAERIGLDSKQLEALMVRILQFLILDYSINSVALLRGKPLDHRPVQSRTVHDWFRGKGCNFSGSPPIDGLANFLTVYHKVYSQRPKTLPKFDEGCNFSGGCVYSDLHAARTMGIPIEADHIIPVSKGGGSAIWEFQPLCRPHNLLKGNSVFWDESRILPLQGWRP